MSELHIPHNTSSTFSAAYGNSVSSFAMYMCKGTFSFVAYTLINTRALRREEVRDSYVEDHHQKVHHSYLEKFQEIEIVQDPSITTFLALTAFQSV